MRWVEELVALGAPQAVRHVGPERLESAIADLRTAALFGGGKVHLFVETGLLEAPLSPAELLEQALRSETAGSEKGEDRRQAALALLRLLRILGIEVENREPTEVIQQIPEATWRAFLASATKGASRMVREAAESALAELLAFAQREGLRGLSEDPAGMVLDLLRDGLPTGHWLVLVESQGSLDHPIAATLRSRGALVEIGKIQLNAKRESWSALGPFLERLERETGVVLAREAVEELIRRTLRFEPESLGVVDSDSLERLEAEYRKLAALDPTGEVRREEVREWVLDRGEEGGFEWLDALVEGRPAEALARLERRLAVAEEPMGERLRLLAQWAGFVRQVWAVGAVAQKLGIPLRPENYVRFRDRIYPRLVEPIPELGFSLLSRSKPYPLYRAFLLACKLPLSSLEALPGRLWQSERRLRGDSEVPEVELASLLGEWAEALRSPQEPHSHRYR